MTMTEEQRAHLMALEGYIILGRPPGSNAYWGYVENSFSMDWSVNHVNFFWSGTAQSVLGLIAVDGRMNAESHLKDLRKSRPDWQIEVWDAKADDLPVILDWEGWVEAHAYDPDKLSGVRDKFAARNVRFEMKDKEV